MRIPMGYRYLLAGAMLVGACGSSSPPGSTGSGGTSGMGGRATAGMGGSATGAGGGNPAVPCTTLPEIPQRVWRLSAQQYANATRDLLALTASPTVESSTDGVSAYALFSDVALTVGDSFLFSGFYQTAENIVTQIAPRIPQIASCMTGDTHTGCAMRFAQTFGQRAFRRPLEAGEVTNLMKVYNSVCPAPSTSCATPTEFNSAISLMVEALILSPSFLYRTELGPETLAVGAAGTLTPYEVATQLGFLFLNSTPDVLLMQAAAKTGAEGLDSPDGISAQVTRLLELPATKANLTTVMTNWFSLGQLTDKTTKDSALLAPLGAADRDQAAIANELLVSGQQFVTDTLWTNPTGKITDLLTSQKVFVNRRLATLYGLPFTGTATGFMAATWPADQPRIGLLSQPSFLWAVSAPSENSIVKRGQFIHNDVICQDALPPPIPLNTPSAMDVIDCKNTGTACDSEIFKSDARMAPGAVCAGCHAQMDPYARVLQNFGPIGNYRTVDERGRPIDTSVGFSGNSPLAPMAIAGPTQFRDALISTKAFANCGIQKMSSYAIGRMVEKYNTCELAPLRTAFEQSNGTISSLFTQIAQADFLRARVGGAK